MASPSFIEMVWRFTEKRYITILATFSKKFQNNLDHLSDSFMTISLMLISHPEHIRRRHQSPGQIGIGGREMLRVSGQHQLAFQLIQQRLLQFGTPLTAREQRIWLMISALQSRVYILG